MPPESGWPANIVRIGPDNLDLLDNVLADVFDRAIEPQLAATALASADALLFVAVAHGFVVGQVSGIILRHPDEAPELYIDNLGVAPEWHRQGIATELVAAMAQLARTMGCAGLWVLTEPDNAAARGFYASVGLPAEPVVMFSKRF